MENSNNSGKAISALLIGAVIGGVLGILFAPRKGSETRKKIVNKSKGLTDKMKENFTDLFEEINKKGVTIKNKANEFMETERDLNAKILKITTKIKNQYPELSKYIEEMQETIPDEKNPEITLNNLKTYYDSLNSMLNKYILERPGNTQKIGEIGNTR